MVFNTFSSNIDEVLLINPSAVNPSTFTQMVDFPTWIRDCDSHSPALLDLFISSDASICSTMAFPPLKNSNYVVASVSIDFPINLK